jgi:hypothetical protein
MKALVKLHQFTVFGWKTIPRKTGVTVSYYSDWSHIQPYIGFFFVESQNTFQKIVLILPWRWVPCFLKQVRWNPAFLWGQPKNVVYWHDLRVNDIVRKKKIYIYMHCGVSDCVYHYWQDLVIKKQILWFRLPICNPVALCIKLLRVQ